MKKGLTLLLIGGMLFSCRKANDLDDLKNKIIGTWELERNICGECITPLTIFPPGNGTVIVLLADGTFERRVQGNILFISKYSVEKSKLCNKNRGDNALLTNEYPIPYPLFIKVEADMLELSTPYCYADGATNIYRRVK